MIKIISKKKKFYKVFHFLKKSRNKNIFLTGGTSTISLYNYLNKKNFFVSKNNFFLTDERIVNPKNFSETNSFSLLKKQKIKFTNFEELYFDNNFKPKKFIKKISSKKFKIDYLFLSFGHDGHISSIFRLNKTTKKNYKFTKSKFHKYKRFTISEKLISNSKKVFLIVKNKKRYKLYKKEATKLSNTPISVLKKYYLILLF